jgi:hypothetical protein
MAWTGVLWRQLKITCHADEDDVHTKKREAAPIYDLYL